jgi:hypothetical protein
MTLSNLGLLKFFPTGTATKDHSRDPYTNRHELQGTVSGTILTPLETVIRVNKGKTEVPEKYCESDAC